MKYNFSFKLDCVIQLGNAKFRTCSQFIHKVK